jgi:superfamily II DNA helicase RecQ
MPGSTALEEELNKFLRSVRILTVNRELVHDGANSFWTLAVEYLSGAPESPANEGRKKIDYREVLSPEDFTLFARLRDWRKEAAHQEGVPVYIIFTNDQLALVAGRRIATKAALGEIEGVGEARIKKYGEAVLEIVREYSRHGEKQQENEA